MFIQNKVLMGIKNIFILKCDEITKNAFKMIKFKIKNIHEECELFLNFVLKSFFVRSN